MGFLARPIRRSSIAAAIISYVLPAPTVCASKVLPLCRIRHTASFWCGLTVRPGPEVEIGDLIVEIRSATAGSGTFTFKFDHMAELTGRTADQIIAARRAAE